MPTTRCASCGEMLKIKDEMLGKRIKCPKCQTAFSATAATNAPMVRGRPAGGSAGRVGQTVAKGQAPTGPSFAISPTIIIGATLVVLLITSIIVYVLFPGATSKKWSAMESQALDDVEAVVTHLIASDPDLDDSLASFAAPHIHSHGFIFPPFAFSLPDEVPFVGVCNSGMFTGKYNTKTKEIQAKVETNGRVNSTGMILTRGTKTFNGTGRVKDGNTTGEIGGKPVTRPVYDPRAHPPR